jgi:hypothetical protein
MVSMKHPLRPAKLDREWLDAWQSSLHFPALVRGIMAAAGAGGMALEIGHIPWQAQIHNATAAVA